MKTILNKVTNRYDFVLKNVLNLRIEAFVLYKKEFTDKKMHACKI